MGIPVKKLSNEKVSDNFDLKLINPKLECLYQYTDHFTRRIMGRKDLLIRQVIDSDELYLLSEARKKIYKKHADYFSQFYNNDYFIDDKDYSSYLFACYFQGEIVGTQRIATYPFEVCQYINNEALSAFLEDDFKEKYIEFSRLAVNNDYGLGRGVAHALNVVAGILVTMSIKKSRYITYSKPKLKRKEANFGEEVLTFTIHERGNEQYELYKADTLIGMSQLLGIDKQPGLSLFDSINNVMMKDEWGE
ncbi:hypothetical protein [uncultured Shewanella sp.]|uniref:hypothetical protein n=1 Tax=uncultured Shewanella sp. TaxID=173975 RepID=UPI00261358C9|nr:hypothetical protein [uncultured Shewanella sp.]